MGLSSFATTHAGGLGVRISEEVLARVSGCLPNNLQTVTSDRKWFARLLRNKLNCNGVRLYNIGNCHLSDERRAAVIFFRNDTDAIIFKLTHP